MKRENLKGRFVIHSYDLISTTCFAVDVGITSTCIYIINIK